MRKLEHAGLGSFRNLLQGEASRDEARAIVRHLLAGCGPCRARAERVYEEERDPSHLSYDAVFERIEGLLGELEESAARRPRLMGQRG
jgi:hypothetical protein